MGLKYQRGQIYYIAGNMDMPPIGSEIWSDRPGLIISNDTANKHSGVIEIIYLTTSFKKRISPTHIKITSGSRQVIALCEQIHTVDQSRIKNYIGSITEEEQKYIDQALMLNLAIQANTYKGLFRKWEHYIREYKLEIIKEQEHLKEHNHDKTLEILKKQNSILEKERNGYRAIAESKQAHLDNIFQTKNELYNQYGVSNNQDNTNK